MRVMFYAQVQPDMRLHECGGREDLFQFYTEGLLGLSDPTEFNNNTNSGNILKTANLFCSGRRRASVCLPRHPGYYIALHHVSSKTPDLTFKNTPSRNKPDIEFI